MLDTDKEEEPCSASPDPWTDGDECEGVDEDHEDHEDREEREERGDREEREEREERGGWS